MRLVSVVMKASGDGLGNVLLERVAGFWMPMLGNSTLLWLLTVRCLILTTTHPV